MDRVRDVQGTQVGGDRHCVLFKGMPCKETMGERTPMKTVHLRGVDTARPGVTLCERRRSHEVGEFTPRMSRLEASESRSLLYNNTTLCSATEELSIPKGSSLCVECRDLARRIAAVAFSGVRTFIAVSRK